MNRITRRFTAHTSKLALSILLFGSSAFGETGLGAIGLHGGLNFSSNANSLAPAAPSTTDYLLGAFYESGGDFFHFQPEFNYVKKGLASYLSIPILFKLKIESPVVRPFILAGPAVALKAEGAGINTFDLSLDLGGGVEFEILPKVALIAEARYSLGFINVSSTAGADIKTRGIYVMAGVSFSL